MCFKIMSVEQWSMPVVISSVDIYNEVLTQRNIRAFTFLSTLKPCWCLSVYVAYVWFIHA